MSRYHCGLVISEWKKSEMKKLRAKGMAERQLVFFVGLCTRYSNPYSCFDIETQCSDHATGISLDSMRLKLQHHPTPPVGCLSTT